MSPQCRVNSGRTVQHLAHRREVLLVALPAAERVGEDRLADLVVAEGHGDAVGLVVAETRLVPRQAAELEECAGPARLGGAEGFVEELEDVAAGR